MTLTATTSLAFPVFVQGLALSLGLIVAIGAQNAFVLRQGLRREHVGSVVLFCAVADAVLIAAGVLGMAQALGQSPVLARALALAGALFLLPIQLQQVAGYSPIEAGSALIPLTIVTLLLSSWAGRLAQPVLRGERALGRRVLGPAVPFEVDELQGDFPP